MLTLNILDDSDSNWRSLNKTTDDLRGSSSQTPSPRPRHTNKSSTGRPSRSAAVKPSSNTAGSSSSGGVVNVGGLLLPRQTSSPAPRPTSRSRSPRPPNKSMSHPGVTGTSGTSAFDAVDDIDVVELRCSEFLNGGGVSTTCDLESPCAATKRRLCRSLLAEDDDDTGYLSPEIVNRPITTDSRSGKINFFLTCSPFLLIKSNSGCFTCHVLSRQIYLLKNVYENF